MCKCVYIFNKRERGVLIYTRTPKHYPSPPFFLHTDFKTGLPSHQSGFLCTELKGYPIQRYPGVQKCIPFQNTLTFKSQKEGISPSPSCVCGVLQCQERHQINLGETPNRNSRQN